MTEASPQEPDYTTMSKEWYEQTWQEDWVDLSRLGPTRRHVRNLILALLEPLHFESVLDVGCGDASLLAEIHRLRPQVQLTGTDISETALQFARRQLPGGSFTTFDLEQETLPIEVDLTICSEVLEHLQADEAAIANLAAMTRRHMVIVVPQGRMRGFERESVGHVRNYTRADLEAKLRRAGFEPMAVIEWGYPFFSPIYRNLLDFLPGDQSQGRMGRGKKIVAELLYQLFQFNSWKRGDKLAILASRQ